MHKRTLVKTLVAVAIGVAVSGAVQAQQWKPSRPINLIVPAIPGSAPDVTARTLGQVLASALGQAVVIDNKPGAASNVGLKRSANSRSLRCVLFTYVKSPTTTVAPLNR